MKRFNDLSFRNKLVLPIGILAFLILANAVVGMQLNERLAKQAFHLADDSLPSIDFLLQADRDRSPGPWEADAAPPYPFTTT